MENDNGNGATASPLRIIVLFLLVVVLPLAAGSFLAPRVVAEPKVGVIRLSYDIFSLTANEVTQQLAYAQMEPNIKAVVLIVNSPGGSAAFSEELYLEVLNTRQRLPVVASIDVLAASGAYFMAAAADEIYAKPTSSVGGIGVLALMPGPVFIDDELIASGPYKPFGGTRDGFVRQVEMAKFSFLEAVAHGRGDRLQTDLSYLARAEIYTGIQAYDLGLVDGLKSTDEAMQRAAALAGLSRYQVVELYPLTFLEGTGAAGYYQPPPIDQQKLWAAPVDLPAGVHYRYVELPGAMR